MDTTLEPVLREILEFPAIAPDLRYHPVPHVVASGKGKLLDDLSSLAVDGHHRGLLRRLGDGRAVVAPLRARGRVLGALVIASRRHRYEQADVELTEVLGRLAGMGVDNARLFAGEQAARRDAERGANRIARLQNVTAALAEALTPRDVAEIAIGDVVSAAGANHGAMLLVNADRTIDVLASTGELAPGERVKPSDTSPLRQTLRSATPLFAPPAEPGGTPAQAAFLPLVLNGRAVGVLTLGFDGKDAFTLEERTFLEALARQCTHALERAQLFAAERAARAQAEASLQALRDSEARYRLLADNTLDMISRLSPDGTCMYVSPACRRVLGVEPEALVGAPFSTRVHAEDAPRLARNPLTSLGTREMLTLTYRQRHADGHYVWVEMTARPLRDAAGRVTEIVAVSRDITERRGAEEEMEAGRRQVARSEKLSALGSLVSGVAHEIRTPLAYLTNNLFLIQARLERTLQADKPDVAALLADVRRMSQEALDGTDRINTLVRDLGRFTRQAQGARVKASLDAVVAEAVRLFQATHRGQVVIESDLQPTPAVELDPFQAQQVVLNLLDNAADAAPPGGSVRVRTRSSDGAPVLIVEDDGPGIPLEIQPRMFDPFFTTKQEGTGLGLSIVQRIVEAHNASLQCDSAPGKGTRFTIRFPRPAEEHLAAPAPRVQETVHKS